MTNKALLTTCFVVVWRTRRVVRSDHAERGRPVVRRSFGHANLMRTIGRSTLSHLSAGGRGRRHRPTSLSRYVLLATERRPTIVSRRHIATAYSCNLSVNGCGRKYQPVRSAATNLFDAQSTFGTYTPWPEPTAANSTTTAELRRRTYSITLVMFSTIETTCHKKPGAATIKEKCVQINRLHSAKSLVPLRRTITELKPVHHVHLVDRFQWSPTFHGLACREEFVFLLMSWSAAYEWP
jgi:hypothetical protein